MQLAEITTQLQDLGNIVVLMGGCSAEREISLRSGQAVYQALLTAGAEVVCADVQNHAQLVQAVQNVDVAFIALHGRWGEDGTVQGILDSLGVAYTGSGVAASAMALDKLRTKWLWQGAGISTPAFRYVSPNHPFDPQAFDIAFPVIVKPVHEGSSIGMRKVNSLAELEEAIAFATQYDSTVLIEQWITGREFTCACLGAEVLPLIELRTDHDFYDFEAKYQSVATQYLCPVELDQATQAQIERSVKQAFEVLGAEGWGRVDLLLDAEGAIWLIEFNSVPGMTDHSLVPRAAAQANLSFIELITRLLCLAKPTA